MDKFDVLLTNLSIKGTYFDVSLYSGHFYLWRNPKEVSIYHWHNLMDHLKLEQLPIYQEPLINQSLFIEERDLAPFLFKTLTFDYPVRDSFIFRHRLYYIDEEGFKVRYPENADTASTLLVKGEFHQLVIGRNDRLILVSQTEGIFEWYTKTLLSWDNTPTFSIELHDNDILQLNEADQPIQLLVFESQKREPYLLKKVPHEKLQLNKTFFNTSLDLHSDDGTQMEILNLFQFLSNEADASKKSMGNPISISKMPPRYLTTLTLNDQVLLIEENTNSLTLRFGLVEYIHLNDYNRYRLFPKSQDYQHHLHLVSQNQVSLFMFHELI